jgi:tetratricopeptide (TPR) repeat protein
LAKSAEKDPTGPAQQISRIRKNLNEFNFDYAARLAQSGQDNFPNQDAFIILKGKAFEGMGDIEKAKSSYQESIKANPVNHEPYIALGDLYSSQGKHLYAALTYSDAVRLDPANEDVRFKQGLGYFKSSEWGRAAASWEDLLYYDPSNQKVNLLLPQAYYILAVEYNRSGQSSLGQSAFRKALNVNRNSSAWLPGSMQTLGSFYREKGLFKESLAAYQEAIELRPNNSKTYLGLGITYWKMKESALAKAAWSKSMELDPTNNDARGWLLLSGKISG